MKLTLNITAFLSGAIFGFGLLVSGFYNPNNVLSFFDVFGEWKAELLITFILSIVISAMAFRIIKNRSLSFANNPLQLPDTKQLDLKLFAGAALFGTGWGIAGICPGPALVLIGSFKIEVVYFFIGLIPGLFLIPIFFRK